MFGHLNKVLNNLYLSFLPICVVFSNDLFNRASGLTSEALMRGVAVGESSRLPVRKGCRPICAVLGCIVMQTTVSMGDVSRPVSRRGWARYE